MKKLIIVFSVLTMTGNVSAQSAGKVSQRDLNISNATPGTGKSSMQDMNITKATPSTGKIGQGDIIFSVANMKEGANSITKVGTGRLEFTKSGNVISNVVFRDETGKLTRLMPIGTPVKNNHAPKNISNGEQEIIINVNAGIYLWVRDITK